MFLRGFELFLIVNKVGLTGGNGATYFRGSFFGGPGLQVLRAGCPG